MKKLNVGIFGCTGMVGREILQVLEKRQFPIDKLRLYASERSAGTEVETFIGTLTVEEADKADFSELDLAFFAIGGGWPKQYAQKAVDANCIVIDNSSTFRYDSQVPLIIPEINPDALGSAKLIANPNCTTAIASIPLYVLHEQYGIEKIFISTYQATSGAGNQGMLELEQESRNFLEGKEVGHSCFQHPIAFNVIPHIDTFQDNGYTREEMKVVWELQKIFGDGELSVSCTAVRVPTMRAHAESIIVETTKNVNPSEVRKLFEKTEGIVVRDTPEDNEYPMPLTASNEFDVEVGRIRQNLVLGDHGIEFFVCGDQLLKGAALNAVQIAELVVKQRFSD